VKNKLVSVIVPIYNVEKYIRKTVESIISQNYENLEIILVDDGSPDKSPEIIDELGKEDSRIVVIHKKNNGVSSARNAGLEIAKGEYITFVDGDDWIEEDYVSYFVSLLEKENSNVVMNRRNFSQFNQASSNDTYIISAEKAIEWIYLGKIFVAVWNKMYRASWLKENNILFDENIWYGEGMLFNIDCLQYTEKVVIGEKCVYHQTPNPNSAMRKFNLKSNYCGIKSLEIQKEHWKKRNKKIEDAWNYHRRAFNWSIMGGLARANMEKQHKEVYKDCAKNLRKNLNISLKVDISMKEKLLYICLAINPYLMAKREKRKVKKADA